MPNDLVLTFGENMQHFSILAHFHAEVNLQKAKKQ